MYNPVRTSRRNGMGGLHGNHFAKNSPTKTVHQLSAATIPPFHYSGHVEVRVKQGFLPRVTLGKILSDFSLGSL